MIEIYQQKECLLNKCLSLTPITLILGYAIYKSFATDIRFVYLIGILLITLAIFLIVAVRNSKRKTKYNADIYVGETQIHLKCGLDGTGSYALRYLSKVEDVRDYLVLTFNETDVPFTVRSVKIPKSKYRIDEMFQLKKYLHGLARDSLTKVST